MYRSKSGALAEGENLRIKVLLHRDACVENVFLIIKNDFNGDTREIFMQPSDYLEDYRFYECDISFNEGIYWYYFRYTSLYGEFFIKKVEHSLGIVSNDGGFWQQTVYAKDFKTPDWLDGGIIYQIFPDRFFASQTVKSNVPQDRYLSESWEKQPEFSQNDSYCRLGNDYYGGDLKGIEEKLPYLKSLGVSCIYLNPIFEAHSNHRYNTADYMKIDPLLGSETDLENLINSAKNQGIYIILDGVFSHTGDDSVYFNKYGRYSSLGAYNSENSPYYSWYKFGADKDDYDAWWGVPSLPEVNENDSGFTEFITGKSGVIRHWIKKGIKGFRLDVADELPDEFLDKIRSAIKADSQENFLLGEVWEDATNKISYGKRRRFLRGKQLDSVMNYPFANAIKDFVLGGNSRDLIDTVLEISENYPPQALKLLMNHIGTHDTPRILTVLGKGNVSNSDREWQSKQKLTDEEYKKGISLLKIAALIQYTLPGIPSLFYGDEVGMQGYGDPFCRGAYPWGKEDTALLEFYKKLGCVRRQNSVFVSGEFIPVYANFGEIVFIRKNAENQLLIALTRWHEKTDIQIPSEFENAECLLGTAPDGKHLLLPAYGYSILKI